LQRRARAIAERCLPAIIAEANYEQLGELLDIFRWFGSPEAMQLEAPADYHGVPGLTLDESNALVRFRIERGEIWAPPGHPDSPEPGPPTPSTVQPWRAAPPAMRSLPKPEGLVRVFMFSTMWFVDPTTARIVSEAPSEGTPEGCE
jgi:hypothetical protein